MSKPLYKCDGCPESHPAGYSCKIRENKFLKEDIKTLKAENKDLQARNTSNKRLISKLRHTIGELTKGNMV